MAQDLSGAELKKRIAEILKDADLETTSAKKVRMQLEEDTKSDLTSRKEEIGKLIQEVIDDMEDEEDEEDEEEEDEKPKNGDIKKNGASKQKDSEEESEESDFSEEEKPKPKKPAPNAGRGRGRGRGRPAGMASSPRKQHKKESSDEGGSDSDFVAESSESEASEPDSGSDYEPSDEDFKAKRKGRSKDAARSSGRRGVRGSAGSQRKRRGAYASASEESEEESSGEEWGRKKGSKGGRGRGKRKQRYESESGSDMVSSDDSEPPMKRQGKATGFTKDLKLSDELAAIVGTSKAPRHEVVKQLWAYIKENKLQDPSNKQFAVCDDKLMKVIGEKKFKCFGMAKYLKDHMS